VSEERSLITAEYDQFKPIGLSVQNVNGELDRHIISELTECLNQEFVAIVLRQFVNDRSKFGGDFWRDSD
jgi:hypothetical protein